MSVAVTHDVRSLKKKKGILVKVVCSRAARTECRVDVGGLFSDYLPSGTMIPT